MELRSPEVVLMEGSTIETVIVGLGNGVGTDGNMKTMHVINVIAFVQIYKQAN
jgi:hypothetical protein